MIRTHKKPLSQTPGAREYRVRRLAQGLGFSLEKPRKRYKIKGIDAVYILVKDGTVISAYPDLETLEVEFLKNLIDPS